MGLWQDLFGTSFDYFRIGKNGVRLKNSNGNLIVRNAADTADAIVTASEVRVSGNQILLNSDGTEIGNDYIVAITRSPVSTESYNFVVPPDSGSPAQVLATNGAGVTTWVSIGSTADKITRDTTSLAFGSSATVPMFTLPANATIGRISVIVDTTFNGNPTMSVGVDGNTSKYLASTQVDLKADAATIFEVHPGKPPNAETEDLIISYAAGGATAGAARIEVEYAVPS